MVVEEIGQMLGLSWMMEKRGRGPTYRPQYPRQPSQVGPEVLGHKELQ